MNAKPVVLMLALFLIAMAPTAAAAKGGNGGGNGGNGGGNGGGNPPPSAACADGTDNDGDGLTDYPDDPGCSSATDTDESNEGAGECTGQFTDLWGPCGITGMDPPPGPGSGPCGIALPSTCWVPGAIAWANEGVADTASQLQACANAPLPGSSPPGGGSAQPFPAGVPPGVACLVAVAT